MDIEFVCEHCGGVLKIQEHLSGQSIECYHCHGMVAVPTAGEKAVIEFACLGCGSKFRVPGSRAGSRTKCPKCDALLVVPDESRAVAPPPETALRPEAPAAPPSTADEYLPPPVKSYVRRSGSYRDRRAGTRSGQRDDDGVIAPPADKVPVGMILFWVALGGLLLVGFILYLNSTSNSRRSAIQLLAHVQYHGVTNFLIIRNDDRFPWHNTTVTIKTSAGDYVMNAGDMSPNQALTPDNKQFNGPGGAWNPSTAVPTQVIIRATLPDGQAGEHVRLMGGQRQPTGGTTPATPPKKAPAPTPAPPPDEGGAVVE